jgi:hypothetical protein
MNCILEMATQRPAVPGRSTEVRPGRPRATRSARRDGRRALFLDFDGVLSPLSVEGTADASEVVHTPLFGWLPVLAAALKPYPDVVIVVHSTWRYTHDLDELRELLGSLGARVGGATPLGPRYESILWWLHLNPSFTDYRILDDDAKEFPNPPPAELILCNPTTGVAGPRVLASLQTWLEK